MNTKEFKELAPYQKILVKEVSSGETYRAMKESDDNAFVYAKGKKRRGYRMMADTFCKWYEIVPQKAPGEVWKKKVNGIIGRLESSGLWPEILELFRNLSKVDYADRERIKDITRCLSYDPARTKAEYQLIYGEFWDKYPFMFNADGVNWSYLFGLSDARTKSMYFGKGRNQSVKEEIKDAIANGKKITERIRAGYDVSFEYDPERNKAWYSEEYRDCGNGHYYLALDSSMALFCEDD